MNNLNTVKTIAKNTPPENIDKEASASLKKFSADWLHIYIFHKIIIEAKKRLWLQIHTLPPFLISWIQFRILLPLLNQSYKHVLQYKNLLDSKGINPKGIHSYKDLPKLPITSKGFFRQYPVEEFINNSFPKWSYQWTETSGSTGEPFKFPLNRSLYFSKKNYCGSSSCPLRNAKVPKVLSADPYVDRFLFWKGLPFKLISENFKFADIRVVNRPRGRHFLHIDVSEIREKPNSVVKKLEEFRPDVLSGRATTMIELSRIIKERNGEIDYKIPFITSVGEMLTEAQRKYLKDFFGSEVYNRYGLEELGDIAIECSAHNGMHIHEESQIVEIVDENDQPAPLGVCGRVIVTSLCNYAVPFIRYDTGDKGEIMTGKCPCGISARRLKIHGRIGAHLELNGKHYQFPEFALVVSYFDDLVLRSQIVKTAKNKIEFRFIPLKPASEKEIDKIRNSFLKNLGFAPDIKIVDEIPTSKTGKTQFLIDKSL